MKNTTIIVLVIIAGIFLMQGYPQQQQQQQQQPKLNNQSGFYPAVVENVVNNKCYGCHSIKGQSQDAKDALMWDSLPGLPKGKMVATFDDLIEVLEDDAMPPEEVVKKYPQAKLLPDEKKILMTFAEAKADSLLN